MGRDFIVTVLGNRTALGDQAINQSIDHDSGVGRASAVLHRSPFGHQVGWAGKIFVTLQGNHENQTPSGFWDEDVRLQRDGESVRCDPRKRRKTKMLGMTPWAWRDALTSERIVEWGFVPEWFQLEEPVVGVGYESF